MRRSTLAGEIQQFKQSIRDREERLSHLDATLRILDPSYRSDAIAPKRLRRAKSFGGGELNRLIVDALRRADRPLGCPEIAAAIVATKGHGEVAVHALQRRCGQTIAPAKTGKGGQDEKPDDGKWGLAQDPRH